MLLPTFPSPYTQSGLPQKSPPFLPSSPPMAASDVLQPLLLPRSSPPAFPTDHSSRPCRLRPARVRRRGRKAGDAAPAKAPELVMGKVTILKRGEALLQLPAGAAAALPASPARKARAVVSYHCASVILSPSPEDVPLPIGLLRNLILSH